MLFRKAVRFASVQPTVQGFLVILAAHLIQQDKAELAKGSGSPYSLGHWLGAKEKVEHDCASVLDSSQPEDLEALKAALGKRYHLNYMPAVKKTIKAIDQFITTGKAPTYPVSAEVKQKVKEEKARMRTERAQAKADKANVEGVKA